MTYIKLSPHIEKSHERRIHKKTILKIKVITGQARLKLFREYGLPADKIEPLFVPQTSIPYCFNEDVSEYHHFIIECDKESLIKYEM